ncbi:hypothetical protein [Wenling picorna-like virus 8]|uniref:hypothetical protein n=1 Tax=Wenling picorna-like virus 8 TaxID=1923536 RepID=UPI000909EF70|nr:hypothetical protein [Wenling picorna-like virus 8]APG78489.1 hypothetical protein [Wenling picorna-like virus 8]
MATTKRDMSSSDNSVTGETLGLSQGQQTNVLIPKTRLTEKRGPITTTFANARECDSANRTVQNIRAASVTGYQEADMYTQTNRRVQVGQFEWSGTMPRGTVIKVLTSQLIMDKILSFTRNRDFYRYSRSSIELQIGVSGSALIPGALLVTWVPQRAGLSIPAVMADKFQNLLCLFPHQILQPQNQVGSKVLGPFMEERRVFDHLTNYPEAERVSGTFFFSVFNTLKTTGAVSVTIFANLVGLMLRFYTSPTVEGDLAALATRTDLKPEQRRKILEALQVEEAGIEDDTHKPTVTTEASMSNQATEQEHIRDEVVTDVTGDADDDKVTEPRQTERPVGGVDTGQAVGWNKRAYGDLALMLARPMKLATFPQTKWTEGNSLMLFSISASDLPKLFPTSWSFMFWSGGMRIVYVSTATYATPVLLECRYSTNFQVLNLSENRQGSFMIPYYNQFSAQATRTQAIHPMYPVELHVSVAPGQTMPADLKIDFYLCVADDFRYQQPVPNTEVLTFERAYAQFYQPHYHFAPNGVVDSVEQAGISDVVKGVVDTVSSLAPLVEEGVTMFGSMHKPDQWIGQNFTAVDLPHTGNTLAFWKDEVVPVDQTVSQFTDNVRYSTVEGYATHMLRAWTYSWPMTADPGQVLGTFPINTAGLPALDNLPRTPLMWRGTIQVSIQAVKAVTQKGMLSVVIHPRGLVVTQDNYFNFMSYQFDISNQQSLDVDVPFAADADYLLKGEYRTEISLMITNRLQTAGGTMGSEVDLNVFMAAGSNFEMKFLPPQVGLIQLEVPNPKKRVLGCADPVGFPGGGDACGEEEDAPESIKLLPDKGHLEYSKLKCKPLTCCDTRVAVTTTVEAMKLAGAVQNKFKFQRRIVLDVGEKNHLHYHDDTHCFKVELADDDNVNVAAALLADHMVHLKYIKPWKVRLFKNKNLRVTTDRPVRKVHREGRVHFYTVKDGTVFTTEVLPGVKHAEERFQAAVDVKQKGWDFGFTDYFVKKFSSQVSEKTMHHVEGATEKVKKFITALENKLRIPFDWKKFAMAIAVKIPAYLVDISQLDSTTRLVGLLLHVVGDVLAATGGWYIMNQVAKAVGDGLQELIDGMTMPEETADGDPEEEPTGWLGAVYAFAKKVTTSIVGYVPCAWSGFLTICRSVGLIGLAVRGTQAIFTAIKACLKMVGVGLDSQEKSLLDLTKLVQSGEVTGNLKAMREFALISPHMAMSDAKKKQRIDKLRKEALLYIEKGSWCKEPEIAGMVQTSRQFVRWAESIPRQTPGDGTFEPVFVYIYGDPGTGKSIMANRMGASVLNKIGHVGERPYSMVAGSAFFTGYYAQQVVIMDDLYASTDGKDAAQIVQIVSPAPFPLPMADIMSKFTIFNAKMVIATSNMTGAMRDWVTCPAAHQRRYKNTCYKAHQDGYYTKQTIDAQGVFVDVRRMTSDEVIQDSYKELVRKWKVHLAIAAVNLCALEDDDVMSKMRAQHISDLGMVPEQAGIEQDIDAMLEQEFLSQAERKQMATWLTHQEQWKKDHPSDRVDAEAATREHLVEAALRPYGYAAAGFGIEPRMEADPEKEPEPIPETTSNSHDSKQIVSLPVWKKDEVGEIQWSTLPDVLDQNILLECMATGPTKFAAKLKSSTGWNLEWTGKDETAMALMCGYIDPTPLTTQAEFENASRHRTAHAVYYCRRRLQAQGVELADVAADACWIRKLWVKLKAKITATRLLKYTLVFVGSLIGVGAVFYAGRKLYNYVKQPTEAATTYTVTHNKPVRSIQIPVQKGLEEKASVVEKKIWRWERHRGDKVLTVNCMVIGGGYALVPAHAVSFDAEHFLYVPHGGGVVSREPVIVHEKYTQQGITSTGHTDIMLVWLGATLARTRDLTNYFMTDKQWNAMSRFQGCALLRNPKTGKIRETHGLVDYEIAVPIRRTVGQVNTDAFVMPGHVIKGECGSPLFNTTESFDDRIVGVVVGGCSVLGYYAAVTQEWIRTAKDTISQANNIPQLQELEESMVVVEKGDATLYSKSGSPVPYPDEQPQCIPLALDDDTKGHVYLKTAYKQIEHPLVHQASFAQEGVFADVRQPSVEALKVSRDTVVKDVKMDGTIFTKKRTQPHPDSTVVAVTEEAMNLLLRGSMTDCRLLTEHQIVNGYVDVNAKGIVVTANAINRQSAAGVDMDKKFGKKKRGEHLKDTALGYKLKKEVKDYFDFVEFELIEGRVPVLWTEMCMKDELRGRLKIREGRVRWFYIQSMALYFLQAKYFGDFLNQFRAAGLALHHTLGLDPPQIWNRLGSMFEGEAGVIDGDVSGWDTCFPRWLYETFRRLVERFYATATMGERRVRLCLLDQAMNTPCLVGPQQLLVFGHKSGLFGTTEISTLCHVFLHLMVQVKHIGFIGREMPMQRVLDITSVSNGDDFLLKNENRMMESVITTYEEAGFKLTSSQKGEELSARDIQDATYLKRRFTLVGGHMKAYVPDIAIETLAGLINWKRTTASVRDNMLDALSFLRQGTNYRFFFSLLHIFHEITHEKDLSWDTFGDRYNQTVFDSMREPDYEMEGVYASVDHNVIERYVNRGANVDGWNMRFDLLRDPHLGRTWVIKTYRMHFGLHYASLREMLNAVSYMICRWGALCFSRIECVPLTYLAAAEPGGLSGDEVRRILHNTPAELTFHKVAKCFYHSPFKSGLCLELREDMLRRLGLKESDQKPVAKSKWQLVH